MMNKLKSNLSLALNTHLRYTILINNENKKQTKKHPLFVLNTHFKQPVPAVYLF